MFFSTGVTKAEHYVELTSSANFKSLNIKHCGKSVLFVLSSSKNQFLLKALDSCVHCLLQEVIS